MEPKWLLWAKQIQGIAQSGRAFSKDPYDQERYKELLDLSADILATYGDVDTEIVKALFARESGYQTPKVDVRGVVFQHEKILLVREKAEQKWSLPGGFCDVGLSAKENVEKEIVEEAGFRTKASELLALYDMQKHGHPPQPFHYYKVFLQCDIINGIATKGLETDQVMFFSKNELPELSANRNTEEQILSMFSFMNEPNQPPYFD
ncbi:MULTISPECIES: NUDIX hydrolase [Bacillaceae]|uniref:ADP-ribose pyrophosphatase n=1 Tax=Alkalicoccobacillus plakortidis TaxID=444060 RepID=A0A9D5I1N3_9BACI|nr:MULTISPECIES: NUDIX hydrolase [Bacillaceae]KQL58399.1 ADP-ribose pyrophosphatase [Alkalicoccobacillus plakortidis]